MSVKGGGPIYVKSHNHPFLPIVDSRVDCNTDATRDMTSPYSFKPGGALKLKGEKPRYA